jgi:FkbM family methyltransferase
MTQFLRKVRVALSPRESLLKTTLANGAVVYGKNRTGFGGRGIYVLREEIEPEFTHLEQFLDADGVFLDIGANTGIYTIKAAKHYSKSGGGVVIALEPFPDVLAVLYRSIQANGFRNVRLRNVCAGASTGTASFWLNAGTPHTFSLLKRDEAASSLSSLVVAVDDLLRWEGVERLDYIKIDVEGAEASVLEGAKESITRFRPIIQAEITINELHFSLDKYATFRAASDSPNNVYIPLESNKIAVAERLGWKRAE